MSAMFAVQTGSKIGQKWHRWRRYAGRCTWGPIGGVMEGLRLSWVGERVNTTKGYTVRTDG